MVRLSWPGYLIQGATIPIGSIVVAAIETHGEWYAYLQWVASQAGVDVTRAQVHTIARTPCSAGVSPVNP